jgi:hypothetical protein
VDEGSSCLTRQREPWAKWPSKPSDFAGRIWPDFRSNGSSRSFFLDLQRTVNEIARAPGRPTKPEWPREILPGPDTGLDAGCRSEAVAISTEIPLPVDDAVDQRHFAPALASFCGKSPRPFLRSTGAWRSLPPLRHPPTRNVWVGTQGRAGARERSRYGRLPQPTLPVTGRLGGRSAL